jgi:hypothetical protein
MDKFESLRFKKSSNMVARLIDDEVVIVPISSESPRQDCIYNLDAMGARVWQLIDGKMTAGDIRDHLLEKLDVGRQQLEKDLSEFFGDLERIGAIDAARENG